MRNPVRVLALKFRNGNGRQASLGAASPSSREATPPVDSGKEGEAGESSARQNETVWYVSEVYQEIWDNEEDAVYDDLPAR